MPPDAVARSVAHLPQRKIWQRYAFAFNPVKLSLFALAYLVAYLCAIATFAVIVTYPIAAAPTREVRRILILNEENATYPGITIINQGIQAGLNGSAYQLQLYSEYMDTSLFPDQAIQQELRDAYIRKYQNRKLDVIITVGPSPLKFMQEVHQKAFPGVPIVFCLPTLSATGPPPLDSDFTGVEDDTAPAETVGIALRLVPGTRNVVVVGGVAPIDREVLANVKKALMSYEGRVEISYLTDLAMPDLLQRLRRLPSNTIILLTSIGQDAARTSFKSNESSPLIIGAANVPVFSLFDVHLNYGEVGGYLSSLSEQGKLAGGMALRLLRGERASQIPRVRGANTYLFDWRALKRWGLKESALPLGSIVINREPTVWDSYKWYIISGISLILLEALLIGGLVWQRAERLKSEKAVRATEERLRLAQQVAQIGTFEWSVGTGLNTWTEELEAIYGLPTGGFSGTQTAWEDLLHPDDRARVIELVNQSLKTGTPMQAEWRIVWPDGSVHWIAGRWRVLMNESGEPSRMVGVNLDLTDRKRAEEALAGVSRRLIQAQEQERTRIGRDLHDDINQQLAMLAVELERLQDDPSEVRTGLQELRKQTRELSNDVQALSHELNSSKLEYLGAVRGMKSWCTEFSERQGIQIEFKGAEVQTFVPSEIGLCLFRVLQEALHNAVKHSEVRRIEVQLREDSGSIHLLVSDLGRGFDFEMAMQGRGLGLTSMQERVRLVNGTIEIQSKPMGGTTIHVRVPLKSRAHLAG